MSQSPRRQEKSARNQVPAEGNFEEHPYFRVGDRNAGTGVMEYNNELRTREGHVLQQSWIVRAATGRGLPGRFDQDVYVALLQLIDERGLPQDGWLSFSIYELVELMGRGHSGRDYRQVRDSLLRLSSTTIESNNAFYHGGKKTYITDSFSLLSQVKLSEYEDPEGERNDRNAVLLSNYFLESYQANYLKNIDSRFYWSLSSPVAKRLYRLIDKKRTGRRIWEAELFSLRKRIPLSEYKYASKIKEKLAPAHAELIEKEFLEEVSYRKGQGGEYAVYRISDAYQERRSLSRSDSLSKEEIFCVQRLKAEGMSSDAAEHMVSVYGHARVMQYVEALPYQRKVRNAAGWLRRAIENGYELDLPPVSVDDSYPAQDGSLSETSESSIHNTPRSQSSLFDGDQKSGSDAASAYDTSPSGDGSYYPAAISSIQERILSGEFDVIVDYLQSLPFEDYSRFVSAPTPVVDRDGNRFYLSQDGDLYIYSGDPSSQDISFICTLSR